jgi:glycosyltransferase involved in cell wall biosynthesis
VAGVVPASVVISSFNEGGLLAETVEGVLSAAVVPLEVIIVDDGSTDGSCDRSWPGGVQVVRQPHIGIAAARNCGAQSAAQPKIIFLDAHCTVADRWLEPLLDTLDRVPDAMVGPAVRDARDTRYIGCGAEIVDALFTYRWRAAHGDGVAEVGLIPGGCLALRRDHFLRAGGFAAFSGFGLEDVEFALRWWRAGHPAFGVPESMITHTFRDHPPYRPDYRAWLQNILRTAVVHLAGSRLRASVMACAQFDSFPTAIASVLAEPWIAIRQRLLDSEVRTASTFLDRWAPRAFLR